MPLYEYQCDVCGCRFECLVRPISGTAAETPHCPTCGSRMLQQQVSSFAVNSAERRQANWNHGRKMAQKDLGERRHAEMEAVVHHHREHGTGD